MPRTQVALTFGLTDWSVGALSLWAPGLPIASQCRVSPVRGQALSRVL